ncbi:hypothetical protein AYL99_07093 [Fonsecaea erecta]|uniref:MRG-binding protein n=1 Tax=Fonsecaea erecta TaxID=1367422 RepID=A0A178ZFN4_9EURO|nr:hypothetical protein AYL99_07093 [Fonsecaea erecta]OAP58003.1 hypothetical protein AYL99_07093 [Fonsecaea erecta]
METSSSSLPTANTLSPPDDIHMWTPAQESALLQAIVRWKPVGMHKHFRMIAIRDHLLSSGAIHPEDIHTSTAGIWRKLASLYDLEKLDEREDSIIFDGSGVGAASVENDGGAAGGDESRSVSSSRAAAEYWRDFELVGDEFETLMWERRRNTQSSEESSPLTQPSSPDVMSAATRRESTVAETDEPRSSPVSVSGRGSGRGRGRGARAGGGGRLSRLQNQLETERSERAASRRTSKAPSVVEPDEDRVMEDAADEDGDEEHEESAPGEDDEEAESGDHEEEEAEQKRSGPVKRGRGGRGRGGRGRKRRR